MLKHLFFLFLVSSATLAAETPQFIFNRDTLVAPHEKPIQEKNLINLFRNKIEVQKYGTCHVYSSTAFLEASCKMLTGKSVDLSESFFILRHFRNALASQPLGEMISEDIFSKLEPGLAGDTIERFEKGEVLSEQEFALTEENIAQEFLNVPEYSKKIAQRLTKKFEQEAIQELKSGHSNEAGLVNVFSLQSLYSEKISNELCSIVDGNFECHLPKELRTKDPAILNCVKEIQNRVKTTFDPSSSEIVAALDSGSPVLCAGKFNALPGNIINETDMIREVYHAFIIYGYRMNTHTKTTEFFVRDSNSTSVQPYSVAGCEQIITIQNETAPPTPAWIVPNAKQ